MLGTMWRGSGQACFQVKDLTETAVVLGSVGVSARRVCSRTYALYKLYEYA
jgi:hypothetical protein